MPQSQPNFFPSALNRKFPNQNDNFLNNSNLNLNASFPSTVNNQMLLKNRNSVINQDLNTNANPANFYNRPNLSNEKCTNYFNQNNNNFSNQNSNMMNPMFKPSNQNPVQSVRPSFNSPESFLYNSSNSSINQTNQIKPNNIHYDLQSVQNKSMPSHCGKSVKNSFLSLKKQ